MHVREQIASLGFKRVIPKNNFEQKKNRQRKINTIIDLSVFLFILQHLRRFLAEKKDNIKISEALIDQTEETEEVRILYHNLWIQDKCLKLKVFWVALR